MTLTGMLIGYLRFHDYPVLATESLISFAIVAGVGGVIGIVLIAVGPTRFRAMLIGLTILCFLDLQFNLIARIFIFPAGADTATRLSTLGIAFVCVFATLMLLLSTYQNIATIIAASAAAFLISAAVVPGDSIELGKELNPSHASVATDRPATLHLLLDGHIGIEGIPKDLPQGERVRDNLLRFYEKWGFRVFGRAYSPYFMTLNSIGSSVNAEVSTSDFEHATAGQRTGRRFQLLKNEYFRSVREAGAGIRVYQSDYVDFCSGLQPSPELCVTYAADSFSSIRNVALPSLAKSRLILDSYFRRSILLTGLNKLFAMLSGIAGIKPELETTAAKRHFFSLAVPAVIGDLRADMLANPGGKFFFAHLLLPHGPYVWDSQCAIRTKTSTWKSRRVGHDDLESVGTESYRAAAYNEYFAQIECVIRLLDDFFTALDNAGMMASATIIVHGDHGSRITLRDPIASHFDSLTKSDYVESFSTLFAIRSPDLEPGYDDRLQPLPNLYAEHLLKVSPPMKENVFFLRNTSPSTGDPGLKPVPMPEF